VRRRHEELPIRDRLPGRTRPDDPTSEPHLHRRPGRSRTAARTPSASATLTLALATALALVGVASASAVEVAEDPPDEGAAQSGASSPPTTQSCPAGYLALTFDDGPDVHTPAVLDTLESAGVLATFFVVGAAVDERPWTTARTDEEGHRVGNHTYHHERLTELDDDEIRETIRRTDAAIRDAGVTPLELLRPTYGDTDDRVRAAVEDTGYLEMLWDLDSRDWESTADEIETRVLEGLQPGAVILFHDGSSQTPETIDALPTIIDEARARGYCLTTLDDDGSLRPLRFDDAGRSRHTAAIERTAAAGITRGCDADGQLYCPDGSVTRAQMASFLDRALDLDAAGDQGFVDVPEDAEHAGAIDRLAAAGITEGCDTDGPRFCPDETVTRAQMASFLDRALELDAAGDRGFVDVPGDATHADPIDRVAEAGISRGCDADGPRFCPSLDVTRAQMATFLDRGVLRR
jgi:peptidoglycan-N-acetylglucosamine deacetylase